MKILLILWGFVVSTAACAKKVDSTSAARKEEKTCVGPVRIQTGNDFCAFGTKNTEK